MYAWPFRISSTSGRMLKQLNTTVITLIPKGNNPDYVMDFRPISSCSVIYNCISKLLCNRLKDVLGTIIDEAQSAFVEGRQIVHNIMLVQELMNQYKRKNISSRCVLKIDLRKAYDSASWSFVEEMLRALKFPNLFISWIMTCNTSTKYSLSLNGGIHGYFYGKKGLRQGDPLSLLIFVFCMEYLSRILNYVGGM